MSVTVFSTIPDICVSPPPPSESSFEPFTPFQSAGSLIPSLVEEDDGFRASFLSPPPTGLRHLSPLCPSDAPVKGQGLARERFENLLKASRERMLTLGCRKDADLRKELAIKAHKSKQFERRARFLAKVHEPPSPSATHLPKTPPLSPAIYNYSLPSPGAISPLAMYEYLENECVTSSPWTEQVDYLPPKFPSRLRELAIPFPSCREPQVKLLPSLDEITARLSLKHSAPRAPLSTSPGSLRSSISVGRLQMPAGRVRSPSPPTVPARTYPLPPSPESPKLNIVTTLVSRNVSSSPMALTENNISRANMLKMIRRRSQVDIDPPVTPEGRAIRRLSAPAELPPRERVGFRHPILNMPGAF